MSRALLSILFIAQGLTIHAQSDTPKPAYDFSLPREERIRLAESAAPPEISSKATVYLLEHSGYVKVASQQGPRFPGALHGLSNLRNSHCRPPLPSVLFAGRYEITKSCNLLASTPRTCSERPENKPTTSKRPRTYDNDGREPMSLKLPTSLSRLVV